MPMIAIYLRDFIYKKAYEEAEIEQKSVSFVVRRAFIEHLRQSGKL